MQKTFEIDAPAELEIRLASGDIDIDPTHEGRVEVELTADDEDSQELIDNATVELRGRTLVVDVPQKRGGFSFNFFGRSGITCRVRGPKGSSVTARTKSADLRARGTIGGLTYATASGDVRADEVAGNVNVKSASGDITIRKVAGSVNAQTASGDVEIDTVMGPVNAQSASGDVTIDAAYGDVHGTVVSGDLTLEAVMAGEVRAQSVSGDVSIGVRRGSKVFLDCNTLSGDTTSELELQTDAPAGDGPLVEINAKTVSGDILIRRAPAPVNDDAQEVHA